MNAQTPTNEIDLAITGMTCDGCANALTRALSRVEGVTRVAV
ncbi:MAG: heavy-metal-associated domain-containing protein, partial [Acetobacteraceae bacterium]